MVHTVLNSVWVSWHPGQRWGRWVLDSQESDRSIASLPLSDTLLAPSTECIWMDCWQQASKLSWHFGAPSANLGLASQNNRQDTQWPSELSIVCGHESALGPICDLVSLAVTMTKTCVQGWELTKCTLRIGGRSYILNPLVSSVHNEDGSFCHRHCHTVYGYVCAATLILY